MTDPARSVAALYVLKSELDDRAADGGRDGERAADRAAEPATPSAGQPAATQRRIVYDERFALPAGWRRFPDWRPRLRATDWSAWRKRRRAELAEWLAGGRCPLFRERCDADFWRRVVPAIERNCGELAHRLTATVAEAVINYAEYSFGPRCRRRRVELHVFCTGDLGYAIVRPAGSKLREFDPLQLSRRRATEKLQKRGWGHTLMMEQARFVGFDQAAGRRGLMIVVGELDEEEG